MAYDEFGLRFLLHAADEGVDFTSTATLGHQSLFGGEAGLASALAACRGVHSPEVAATLYRDCAGYVDGFLRYLGAEQVDSIDASDYENATLVHDLNAPITPDLEERYSVVVEGGTLEHVFDFPTAIRNSMRMVRQGGHLILRMPVNNAAGHGFYQFSPELLFRVLSPRFGYRICEVLLIEPRHPGRGWYRVADPAAVGRRIQFRSHSRTVMFVLAERLGPVPELNPPPMQSDYETKWDGQGARSSSPGALPRNDLKRRVTKIAKRTKREVMSTAQHTVPKRIQRSRPFRLLKRRIAWTNSGKETIPHYTEARRGFERVDEPWTGDSPLP